jgi:aldose 1-epimerase
MLGDGNQKTSMGINKMTSVKSVMLKNASGMTVEIIDYGARIKSIKFPINDQPTEMVVGYTSAQDYVEDPYYIGATCGRVCNRLAKGQFQLDDIRYQLPINDSENCLHGGIDNFSMRYWQIDQQQTSGSTVCLNLRSKDGDQGFPGQVDASVRYHLTPDNKLDIQYIATTTDATPINFTNHSYFHLGEKNGEQLSLQLNASAFLKTNILGIPSGDFVSVMNTSFDFRAAQLIRLIQKAYDHCYMLDNSSDLQAKAVLISKKNNIQMKVFTDQPAMQLYTGHYLSTPFKPYQGICLEAQNYIDAINFSHFPNSVLRADTQYKRQITFGFESIN